MTCVRVCLEKLGQNERLLTFRLVLLTTHLTSIPPCQQGTGIGPKYSKKYHYHQQETIHGHYHIAPTHISCTYLWSTMYNWIQHSKCRIKELQFQRDWKDSFGKNLLAQPPYIVCLGCARSLVHNTARPHNHAKRKKV